MMSIENFTDGQLQLFCLEYLSSKGLIKKSIHFYDSVEYFTYQITTDDIKLVLGKFDTLLYMNLPINNFSYSNSDYILNKVRKSLLEMSKQLYNTSDEYKVYADSMLTKINKIDEYDWDKLFNNLTNGL